MTDVAVQSRERYTSFDRSEVANDFVHTAGRHHRQATLMVDGIHCASCSVTIENGLLELDGVQEIHVNPSTHHANLSWDPTRVRLSDLMGRIDDLGFKPHALRRETRNALNLEEYRAALKRLIVAGLGMMQVMTYAVAGYAGAFEGIDADYQRFFRLLSLLVATPVVVYSAAPFFRAAVTDLSMRRVGMDVPVALAIGIAYVASVAITFFGQPQTEVYFDSVVMFTFFLSLGRFAEMLARHRTVATSEALSESLPARATRLVPPARTAASATPPHRDTHNNPRPAQTPHRDTHQNADRYQRYQDTHERYQDTHENADRFRDTHENAGDAGAPGDTQDNFPEKAGKTGPERPTCREQDEEHAERADTQNQHGARNEPHKDTRNRAVVGVPTREGQAGHDHPDEDTHSETPDDPRVGRDAHPGGSWREEEIALADIRAGDRLLVRPGETIPADGIVAWGASATDESLLTGESRPNTRREGDAVVGGSLNLTGPLHIIVTETGSDTILSGIARLLERAQGQRPRMAQLADRVAGYFVAGVLLIAGCVLISWLLIDPGRALTVTLSVLVVTCPCALSLATPTALTAATGNLARNGLLVTRSSALETLAKADTLLLDKTGTLTRGRLRITSTRIFDHRHDESHWWAIAAALESGSAHPVAAAFGASPSGIVADPITVHTGRGIEGVIDHRRFRVGRGEFVGELSNQAAEPALQGGVSTVFLGDEQAILAAFDLEDALRPEATRAIDELRATGLRPAILSGDAETAVERVASALAVDDWHAGLLPADKLTQLEQRRDAGRIVAMVGDGINDAPVLAGADVSIAMGSGSSLAQASADLILMGGGLDRLARGVKTARQTRRVIRQNLGWAVVYNLVALPLAAAGFVAPWMAALGMSASSLIVVLNAMRLRAGERGPLRSVTPGEPDSAGQAA